MKFWGKAFVGGIHPKAEKESTQAKPIRRAKSPKKAVIPLSQHTGALLEPKVAAGDLVKVGQKIGDSDKFVSAPVHASISGKVAEIKPYPHPALGRDILSIIIESDGRDEVLEGLKPYADPLTLSPEEIKKIIREAGIVGLGGAMFPTAVKLSPPAEKKIDTIILNGAECEPYLTCDHRLMLEEAKEILLGLKIILKVTGAGSGYIGIEDNKPDAIGAMKEAVKDEKNIQVIPVKTKYPQGGEKQLIKSVLNRVVPSGGLPLDVGVIVQNVGTAYAIAQTFSTGLPLTERVVTITGRGVKEPANLRVKIGTLVSDLIEECGGFTEEVGKVIMGGPLMGIAQHTLEVPVIKGTTGILIQTKKEPERAEPSVCIRCARCVDVCPMFLLPNFLGDYAEHGRFEDAGGIGLLDCIECGACAYICASKRDLVQLIKLGKAECQKKS